MTDKTTDSEKKNKAYTCPECFKQADKLIVIFYERRRKWVTTSGSCKKCNPHLREYIKATYNGKFIEEKTLSNGRELTAHGTTYKAP